MRFFLPFFFIFLGCLPLISQPHLTKLKVIALIDSGDKYASMHGEGINDLKKALIFYEKAEQLNSSLSSDSLSEEITIEIGQSYIRSGDLEKGRKRFVKLINKFKKSGDKESEATAWCRFGWAFIKPGHFADLFDESCYTEMMDCLLQSVNLARSIHNKTIEARALTRIAYFHFQRREWDTSEKEIFQLIALQKVTGINKMQELYQVLQYIYMSRGNLEKALYYALEGIKSGEASHAGKDLVSLYMNLGVLYYDMQQMEKSITAFQKSLEINKLYNKPVGGTFVMFYSNALIKQNRAKDALNYIQVVYADSANQTDWDKQTILESYADIYVALKKFKQAETIFLKSLSNQRSRTELSSNQLRLGRFYVERQLYLKAIPYLKLALQVSKDEMPLSSRRTLYSLLFKADSALGNYKLAIADMQRYQQINDSIFNLAKTKQIQELEMKYEIVKKEKNMQRLKNENKLQYDEIYRAGLIKKVTFGGIILLVIIIGLLMYLYQTKQRSNNEIHKKNKTLNHLLEEKEWLLKEVHHRVKNNLQIVMSLLNSQSTYMKDEITFAAIKDSQRRVHAMSLIHQKLYSAENVSTIEMSVYIYELIEYLRECFNIRTNILVKMEIEPIEMDVSQAIPIGLILNEAITNAIKYAFPSEKKGTILISLEQIGETNYLLVISDDGIGMPSNYNLNSRGSLGMSLIKGLSEDLNGTLKMETENGTTLKIQFVYDASVKK